VPRDEAAAVKFFYGATTIARENTPALANRIAAEVYLKELDYENAIKVTESGLVWSSCAVPRSTLAKNKPVRLHLGFA
jgi:hypothetical protein